MEFLSGLIDRLLFKLEVSIVYVPLWPFVLALVVGLLVGIFITVAVTKHRAKKIKLQESQDKQTEQIAFMGTLASGLTHEIKTPLSTLDMNLQMLEEDWRNPVTEREQRGYKKIQALLRSVRKLDDILRAFIRFAQGHKLMLERVNLNQLLEESIDHDLADYIRMQQKDHSIKILKELDQNIPKLQLDRTLMRQAIMNLLINAVQAITNEGVVRIKTSSDRKNVIISIHDNGEGITQEIQDKIFNIYFSTKPAGIGLGLPTTKRIISEHNGEIRVQSEPSKGSTFEVILPIR